MRTVIIASFFVFIPVVTLLLVVMHDKIKLYIDRGRG